MDSVIIEDVKDLGEEVFLIGLADKNSKTWLIDRMMPETVIQGNVTDISIVRAIITRREKTRGYVSLTPNINFPKSPMRMMVKAQSGFNRFEAIYDDSSIGKLSITYHPELPADMTSLEDYEAELNKRELLPTYSPLSTCMNALAYYTQSGDYSDEVKAKLLLLLDRIKDKVGEEYPDLIISEHSLAEGGAIFYKFRVQPREVTTDVSTQQPDE